MTFPRNGSSNFTPHHHHIYSNQSLLKEAKYGMIHVHEEDEWYKLTYKKNLEELNHSGVGGGLKLKVDAQKKLADDPIQLSTISAFIYEHNCTIPCIYLLVNS